VAWSWQMNQHNVTLPLLRIPSMNTFTWPACLLTQRHPSKFNLGWIEEIWNYLSHAVGTNPCGPQSKCYHTWQAGRRFGSHVAQWRGFHFAAGMTQVSSQLLIVVGSSRGQGAAVGGVSIGDDGDMDGFIAKFNPTAGECVVAEGANTKQSTRIGAPERLCERGKQQFYFHCWCHCWNARYDWDYNFKPW
jgi:hypothetical protein